MANEHTIIAYFPSVLQDHLDGRVRHFGGEFDAATGERVEDGWYVIRAVSFQQVLEYTIYRCTITEVAPPQS